MCPLRPSGLLLGVPPGRLGLLRPGLLRGALRLRLLLRLLLLLFLPRVLLRRLWLWPPVGLLILLVRRRRVLRLLRLRPGRRLLLPLLPSLLGRLPLRVLRRLVGRLLLGRRLLGRLGPPLGLLSARPIPPLGRLAVGPGGCRLGPRSAQPDLEETLFLNHQSPARLL